MLGLCCCEGFSPAAASRGYSLVVVRKPLTMVASLVGEYRLQGLQASIIAANEFSSCGSQAPEHRLNSCGAQAQPLRCIWGSSLIRDLTHVSCIGRQILHHWATREALDLTFLTSSPEESGGKFEHTELKAPWGQCPALLTYLISHPALAGVQALLSESWVRVRAVELRGNSGSSSPVLLKLPGNLVKMQNQAQ